MLTTYKKRRDKSGQSGHTNEYRSFECPELMSRLFPSRDKNSGPKGYVLRDSALDCAAVLKRPMSGARRSTA